MVLEDILKKKQINRGYGILAKKKNRFILEAQGEGTKASLAAWHENTMRTRMLPNLLLADDVPGTY